MMAEKKTWLTNLDLDLRKRIRTGCWNFRMMLEISRLAHINREMQTCKLEIPVLSEIRLREVGEHAAIGGEHLIYSGRLLDDNRESRVAISMSKYVKQHLI